VPPLKKYLPFGLLGRGSVVSPPSFSPYRTSGVTKFPFGSSAVMILFITILKIPVLDLCWLNVSGAGGSVALLNNGTDKVVFVYFVQQSKFSVYISCTHE
jgi:hypothetical protein